MKAVMENFSSGISTFNDFALNLWTYDIRLSCAFCFMVGFLYVLAPMKWETNVMESSVNDEIKDGEILLNRANVGPFSMIAKALHRMGS